MVTPPPPPPGVVVQKKRGLGCFGCGCLIVLVLLVLLGALLGGASYYLYATVRSYTSPGAVTVPTYDGGDAVYQEAEQKLTAFQQTSQQHQPASLHLKADEINTLIARDPNWAAARGRVFVTLQDSHAHVQVSLPFAAFEQAVFTDRYLNGDATFTLGFDSGEKSIQLLLQELKLGDRDLPPNFNDGFNQNFNRAFNEKIREKPEVKDFLDHTRKLEIENDELVLETN